MPAYSCALMPLTVLWQSICRCDATSSRGRACFLTPSVDGTLLNGDGRSPCRVGGSKSARVRGRDYTLHYVLLCHSMDEILKKAKMKSVIRPGTRPREYFIELSLRLVNLTKMPTRVRIIHIALNFTLWYYRKCSGNLFLQP